MAGMSGFPANPTPSIMSETSIKSGKVDLEKLLKHTKHHPKGRVQMDENGEIKNPKNPVIEKDVEVKTLVDGKEVVMKINRYGGHVKGEEPFARGGVWRAGLCKKGRSGPEVYFEMCELYARRKAAGKGKDDFRPELELAEVEDYQKWLKEAGKKHPVDGEFPVEVKVEKKA